MHDKACVRARRVNLNLGPNFYRAKLVASVRPLVRPEAAGLREGLEAEVADLGFVASAPIQFLLFRNAHLPPVGTAAF